MTTAAENFAQRLRDLSWLEQETPCQRDKSPDNAWTSEDPQRRDAARALCAGCPLFTECLEAAIETGVTFTVRAGIDFGNESTRRALRRQYRKETA